MSSDTILVRATEEQYRLTFARQLPEWGNGLTLARFTARELEMRATPFGQALQCWMLVPADDRRTLDPLCSCETYRRPALLASGRSPAYSIASVFTATEHRKKGHARRMMALLHEVLAITGSEPEVEAEVVPGWQGGHDGVISVLYSDVGDFYSKCGQGWHIRSPIETTWTVALLPPPPSTPSPPLLPIPFDLPTLTAVAQADSILLAPLLSHGDVLLEPTGATFHWHITRSIFHSHELSLALPPCWGFESPSSPRGSPSWAFLVFTIDRPKATLKVLRFRPGNATRELLRATFEVARESGCRVVKAWNVPKKEVLEVLGETGEEGETRERTDSLSAVARYRAGVGGDWVANEGYGWC